jgi:hypothetical protein
MNPALVAQARGEGMVTTSFEQHVADMEAMPDTIANEVQAVPASRWTERVFQGEGGWNRRQLLAHLASINIRQAQRLRAAAGLPQAAATNNAASIDDWNAVEVRSRDGRTVDELLAELRATRTDLVGVLRALTPDQRAQVRIPRSDRTLTLDEWLPTVAQHDRTHLGDIVR